MTLQDWVAYTQIASNIAVVIGVAGLLLNWLQWRTAKGIQKERIEDLTDEIMFFAEYYDNKLNSKGFVPRKTLIPVGENAIPQIREAIRQRLIQEIKP